MSSRTWYRHGARLLRRAPDPQLAVFVVAPAHDSATRHESARVVIPRGDGGVGEDYEEEGCGCGKEGRGACVSLGAFGALPSVNTSINNTSNNALFREQFYWAGR